MEREQQEVEDVLEAEWTALLHAEWGARCFQESSGLQEATERRPVSSWSLSQTQPRELATLRSQDSQCKVSPRGWHLPRRKTLNSSHR